MSSQPIIHLPDSLARWPWQRDLNPHYEACKAESAEWLESFGAFRPKAQRAFNLCDFSECLSSTPTSRRIPYEPVDLLASLSYPKADKGQFCVSRLCGVRFNFPRSSVSHGL